MMRQSKSMQTKTKKKEKQRENYFEVCQGVNIHIFSIFDICVT